MFDEHLRRLEGVFHLLNNKKPIKIRTRPIPISKGFVLLKKPKTTEIPPIPIKILLKKSLHIDGFLIFFLFFLFFIYYL